MNDYCVQLSVDSAEACLRMFEQFPILRDGAVARELRAALDQQAAADVDCGHGAWEPIERSDAIVECIVCGRIASSSVMTDGSA